MRIYIPFALVPLFFCYLFYLAFIKKELKQNLSTVVYPGLFFITTWVILYYFLVS